jgi:hypothetical protein
MFLSSRRFMYQQVYFHRTVRAIDLDLAEVFGPSIRAIFGDGSPADRLAAYADLDEYALLHQAARVGARLDVAEDGGADRSRGDGRVPPRIAEAWRAILLRQPTWRAEAEVRAEYEAGERPDELIATLGEPRPAGSRSTWRWSTRRPADATATDRLLALEGRDGRQLSLAAALASIPTYWLVGRRYRRR